MNGKHKAALGKKWMGCPVLGRTATRAAAGESKHVCQVHQRTPRTCHGHSFYSMPREPIKASRLIRLSAHKKGLLKNFRVDETPDINPTAGLTFSISRETQFNPENQIS
jgi:hypothetical protein